MNDSPPSPGPVVVTGASGFVAKWTIVEALRAGYGVVGSLRSEARAPEVMAAVSSQLGNEPLLRLSFIKADLLEDAGWANLMAGAAAVIHVAAAIRADEPKDASLVLRPAVEGTARVLKFAAEAGVRRVVMTSSVATVGYGHGQRRGTRIYTDAHFTNLENMRWPWAYCIGKTMAEQQAWQFVTTNRMQLTTVHPGAIYGPALDDDPSISVGAVTGLLDGTLPALPNMGFAAVDVRDVAELQVRALSDPGAIGERYLAAPHFLQFKEMAELLRKTYPDAKITSKQVPNWIIRLMARFGGPVRQIIDDIGQEKHYDSSKGAQLLGRPWRSAEEAVLSAAESALRLGRVGAR